MSALLVNHPIDAGVYRKETIGDGSDAREPDYLLEAIRAGAAGYILKDAEGERLVGL